MNSLNELFLRRVKQIKKELSALQVAVKLDLIPWYAKLLVLITVAYVLSPIDLIPDFIPVLGLLDDLIIIPLLIALAIKIIPQETMDKCRKIAEESKFVNEKNWIAGGIIIILWITLIIWIIIFLAKA